MSNKLGLRIGSHAIGWTFYQEKEKTLKMGVRVFPVPIEHFGAGKREQSHRAKRRHSRMMRKRFARFRQRKIHLLKILSQVGMCPVTSAEIQDWQQHKAFPHKTLKEWLEPCPYSLRKKGLSEALSLAEMGRILYHISQRRGYFVGRRMEHLPQKYLFQGSPEYQRPGILEVEKDLKKEFLGGYLHQFLPLSQTSYLTPIKRVRNRYLARRMYVQEIHAIWKQQEQHHSELTPVLRDRLIGKPPGYGTYTGGVIFFQRPFGRQKNQLNNCPYEKNKSRALCSHPLYEELRAWQWVNSIRLKGEPLPLSKKQAFLNYFLLHGRFTFWEALQAIDPESKGYNKHYRKSIHGGTFQALMQQPGNFGSAWSHLSEAEQIDIWHCFYFFNDQEKLAEKAQQDWGFSSHTSGRISRIFVDKRTAPLSVKAIRNILQFLRSGFAYDQAVFLAGLKQSLRKNEKPLHLLQEEGVLDELLALWEEQEFEQIRDRLQIFCDQKEWILEPSRWYGKTLHTSPKGNSRSEINLPSDRQIEQLNHPLHITVAYQVRKIIGQLLRQFGPIDCIKITFDTDLKVNRMQRGLYIVEQKRKQKLRERFIQILENNNLPATESHLERMELWGESNHTCPYSGIPITFEELFTEAVKVVLIHPWSQSLNRNTINKVLCREEFADQFQHQSPYDFFGSDSKGWKEVKDRIRNLFVNRTDYPFAQLKAEKFLKRFPRKNYLKFQWQENGLIGNTFTRLLEGVCPEIYVHSIHGVGYLLEHWQSEMIRGLWDRSLEKDFRLKGLQAAATLFLTPEYLHFLSRYENFYEQDFPTPFPKFAQLLAEAYAQLLVTHVQKKKILFTRNKRSRIQGREVLNAHVGVRGSIHRETRYGKAKAPYLDEAYHVRKPLGEFSSFRQINKIVDPQVRAEVLAVAKRENPLSEHTLSKKTFFDKDEAGYEIPKVFLPNRQGDPVPVRKVRIREILHGAVQLHSGINSYVNPRKNHHITIYRDSAVEYRESVVSFWEALQRLRKKESLYQLPVSEGQLICNLHINDLFLLGLQDPGDALEHFSKAELIPYVYRVQKLSKHFYEFRRTFDTSLYDYTYPNYVRINNFGDRKTGWFSYNPYKIQVNSLGDIIPMKKENR
ncbi:MAG: type II CRISPR RNA-guided endonuclease Cas9 [Flavobacteriaceae bacterium]